MTATLEGDKLVYESVNTCIALLPSVAGKLLITVEGLADEDGNLHPVQQAMVSLHGSQCGFCTPGFVMTLFAHVKNGAKGDREDLLTRLSGNLCRCTGYLPIIRAGMSLDKSHAKDHYHRNEKTIKQRLRALRKKQGRSVLRPATENAVATRMARKKPRIVAGSTDLGLDITQDLEEPELVFVDGVKAMSGIRTTPGKWVIGAATTWEEVDQVLSPHLPGMAELMYRFGSPQIRARATVGGNLCNASPIADGPPVFLALGCELVLRKGSSSRRVRLEDFYKGYRKTVLRPGEFVKELHVDRPAKDAFFNVYKVSRRFEDDLSTVCGAYLVRLDKGGKVKSARIAYGGMDSIPMRATRCEQALLGKDWDESAIDDACEVLTKDYSPSEVMRTSPRYRNLLAGNLLRRFHLWTVGEPSKMARAA